MKTYRILARITDRGENGKDSRVSLSYMGLVKGGKQKLITAEGTMNVSIQIPQLKKLYYVDYVVRNLDDKPAQGFHIVGLEPAKEQDIKDLSSSTVHITGKVDELSPVKDMNTNDVIGYLFQVEGAGIRIGLEDIPALFIDDIVTHFSQKDVQVNLQAVPLDQPIYDQFGQISSRLKYGIFRTVECAIPTDEEEWEETEETEESEEDKDMQEFEDLFDNFDSEFKTKLPPMTQDQAYEGRRFCIETLSLQALNAGDDKELKKKLLDEMIFRLDKYEL